MTSGSNEVLRATHVARMRDGARIYYEDRGEGQPIPILAKKRCRTRERVPRRHPRSSRARQLVEDPRRAHDCTIRARCPGNHRAAATGRADAGGLVAWRPG